MRRWFARALALFALLLSGAAWAQGAGSTFDHTATGYPLRGKHEEVRCETCHLRGIFRGTPRDCVGCHVQNNPRGALEMPSRHVQTLQSCDSCHSVRGFSGATFSHFGVSPGGCNGCHLSGIRAPAKPLGHMATADSCDQCHGISAFLPAAALPDNHIKFRTGASCSACHTNEDWKRLKQATAPR